MPSDTRNVKLGVCSVTFDGVDLGYTKGGVEVTVQTTTHEVKVDQFGESPIDDVILGRTCMAKVPLAETTLENMVRVVPGAELIGSGGAKATGTVTFTTGAPVNDDSVTVNGVAFTFKTVPAGPNQIAIPASINAAATALRDAINNSIDPAVSQVTASAATGVVTITADDAGTAGNAITLAKVAATPANLTVSGATLSGGTDHTKKKVEVGTSVSTSLLALAKKLVLHPKNKPAEDRSEDFTIPLTNTSGNMNFAYKLDAERIFDCEFKAYPDPTTGKLFIVGDETATAA